VQRVHADFREPVLELPETHDVIIRYAAQQKTTGNRNLTEKPSVIIKY
jgi:hypothetical protein